MFSGCWTQWQRFESSSTHCFWDTPLHFLKTHFCWENDFLSFLELQKSPLVSFQGSWTQWQRFESSSIHHFSDTPLHFLKTCFNLESGCRFIPRAPVISTSNFSGVLNTMAKWSRWVQIWQIYPPDLPADVSPYSHLVAKNGNFRFLLSQLI